MRKSTLLLVTAAASVGFAGIANADTLVALIGDDTLAMIDTETWTVTGTMAVSGDVSLRGIDVRPSDGALYGLTTDGTVVMIDPAMGSLSEPVTLSETVGEGLGTVVDFNPVADRLRVIGSDGVNHRINLADGAVTVDTPLTWAAGDAMAGMTPNVIAGAYTNSAPGPAPMATQLFDIDSSGNLLLQAPPNDGVLNTVGMLGVDIGDGPVAFDIGTLDDGSNVGWLMVGTTLYSVNLDTAEVAEAATFPGLEGTVTDIALMAE